MSCPLRALLNRCHRDELLRLAAILRLDPAGKGLSDLAAALARAARRQSTNALVTLVRPEGRPWFDILFALSRKERIEPKQWPPTFEELETGLVRHWFAQRWDALDPAARAVLWNELGFDGAVPERGSDAVGAARKGLGRGLEYGLSNSITRFATPAKLTGLGLVLAGPVGIVFRPVLLPVLLWWMVLPSEERMRAIVLEVARLRQVVLHRVTIGVVGSPSTGKDAAIKALFGLDSGNISPVAGSTKEVSITRLPGSTALYLVNTPGMGDVVERVTEEARQVFDHIDLYLYLVNAEGGVQAREQQDHARCRATGKPVLAIVNKIDVLRPDDKEEYLADARAKLGAPEEDFVAVAFDPLPQLAPGPMHVEAVRNWLLRRLGELGKDPSELPVA